MNCSKKSFSLFALVLSILTGLAVAESENSKDTKTDTSMSAPLKYMKGTVKAKDGKVTIISDKDYKSWDVTNPEALKGQEGHHVQVGAQVYSDKNQIHVMSVKFIGPKSGPPTGEDPPPPPKK